MGFRYALVTNNDNQCNVTRMITAEVDDGTVRCFAYVFKFQILEYI